MTSAQHAEGRHFDPGQVYPSAHQAQRRNLLRGLQWEPQGECTLSELLRWRILMATSTTNSRSALFAGEPWYLNGQRRISWRRRF